MKAIVMVRQPPNTDKVTSRTPISSWKVRNSMRFKSQEFLSWFELYSGGQVSHVTASESRNTFKQCNRDILRKSSRVLPVILLSRNRRRANKATSPAGSLVVLLHSLSAHGRQSKQQRGLPFTKARRVPGRQLSLQPDRGTWCREGIGR